MKRIYRRRTLKLRFWTVLALLLSAVVLAIRLDRVGVPPDDPAAQLALRLAIYAPAALFAAGAAWLAAASWRCVGAFEVDLEEQRFRLWLWRPVGWRRIDGTLDRIAHWRYEGRRGRHAILATLKGPPTGIRFEVRRHRDLVPAWRRIAPDAIAAYERETGLTLGE